MWHSRSFLTLLGLKIMASQQAMCSQTIVFVRSTPFMTGHFVGFVKPCEERISSEKIPR